ncbi:tRNA synthetase class II [Phlyctema vagabunda]|uniref:tRNA synthetase class II n=1 Tax=Phlyctema vagabunda TaxID=108571 RepID=A0ABR4PDH6_9HELO
MNFRRLGWAGGSFNPSLLAKYTVATTSKPFRTIRISSLSATRARTFHLRTRQLASESAEDPVSSSAFWKEYKESFHVEESAQKLPNYISEELLEQKVTFLGYIGRRRILSDKLAFVDLTDGNYSSHKLQLVSRVEDTAAANGTSHEVLKRIRQNSYVAVTGVLQLKRKPKDKANLAPMGTARPEESKQIGVPSKDMELKLESIRCLSSFPEDISVEEDTNYGPTSRHLQLRFDNALKSRIEFRSKVADSVRKQLVASNFMEVETPILFKSTPEGAREFLVPTRRAGHAYALPQSPQQYKQILMASGIHRYYQFARCFRDEDLRADRQPEFTQIDLELACTSGNVVMEEVEKIVKNIYNEFPGDVLPVRPKLEETPFQRMTYMEAMSKHGSDKPDLRIRDLIHRVENIVPSDLLGMLTDLNQPALEAFKFRLKGGPIDVHEFVKKFLDSQAATTFRKNPDGAPGVFIYDSRKPLEGLQAFGFEGAEQLKTMFAEAPSLDYSPENASLKDGDLIIIQARENKSHSGGSTSLGRLRIALYKAAIAQGLLDRDPRHRFLWITDFPLFTPNEDGGPGQGGSSGFSATHHPFTAPKTSADVDLLLEDPLKVTAEHYDLVVNGVELGGGSRRIHNAGMQKFVMRDILMMSEERLNDFSHLFEALRSGCPPHAGFAIGFDRLLAVMSECESVKDVIAFPKSSKGEDLMVRSPTSMTEQQLDTYHLRLTKRA